MPILNSKSDQNYKASLLLRDHKHFAPAVHAAYYSCFQKVLHILERDYSKSYEKIITWCKEKHTSTHVYCINEVSQELRKKDRNASAVFKSKMLDLKGFREDSDYTSKEIQDHDVVKAQTHCIDILKLINHHFA